MASSINGITSLKLSAFEKIIYPFFNALPNDVPVGWLIPFLYIVEDLQYLPYFLSDSIYDKIRPWAKRILTIFNPEISNSLFLYFIVGALTLLTIYIYIILFYHILKKGRKTLSKGKLRTFNALYIILFRYLLTFVLNLLTQCTNICHKADEIPGIPECGKTISNILIVVVNVCAGLIALFNFLYNNFYFNTNCLSNGKFFGTIQKANNNILILTKLILAYMNNVIPSVLIKIMNQNGIRLITLVIITLLYLYLSYSQLICQPYYSVLANNYRYAVYFSLGGLGVIGLLTNILGLNTYQIIVDLIPGIFIMLFIIGYTFNRFYYRKVLLDIYKRLNEREVLEKSISNNELQYNPMNYKNKTKYSSIERITQEKYIRKEIKVFNNYYHCEMACRFLRTNRSIEAYNLMRKIFDEGMIQYKHEPEVYIVTWYYIYTMKNFYRENNLLNKYDLELFQCDKLLHNAMDLKLDWRKKYLVSKAENLAEREKRNDEMNAVADNENDIINSFKLEELKNEVVILHIEGLNEIKNLFEQLKSSTNLKDVQTYVPYISQLCKKQNMAYSRYKYIIRDFPDAKDIMKIYVLFLMDIMGKEDVAFKYMNTIGNTRTSLRTTSNDGSSKVPTTTFKSKKALTASSNSLASVPYSEDVSATGMGREMKRKINFRNVMLKKFITPIKEYKLIMNLLVLFFIIFCTGEFLCTYVYFNKIIKEINNYSYNVNVPGYVKEAAFNVRMISNSLITNDTKTFETYRSLLEENINNLIDIYDQGIGQSLSNVVPNRLLISPVAVHSYDTFKRYTLDESYRRLIANLKFVHNQEMPNENITGFDILYEPHFKFFIANSDRNFDDIFNECRDRTSNNMLNIFEILSVTTITFSIILFLITLIILYITFGPFKKSTNKITYNIFRTFRFISQERMEEMIKSYDEKISEIYEKAGIDHEFLNSNSKIMNKRSYRNLFLVLSFIFIYIYILLEASPVLMTITKTRNAIYILNQSSERVSLLKGIQLYTYEIIYQDKSMFLESEPNRILNSLIKKIETNQNQLKTGSYGGPTFDEYPTVNRLLKENGCYFPESQGIDCESIEYDTEYGYSEELATQPLNELIREYIYYVKSFINDVNNNQYIQLPYSNKENIKIMFNQEVNDNFFKLQEKLMVHMIGAIHLIDEELVLYSNEVLHDNLKTTVEIMIFGIIVLLLIVFLIFNKIYEEKVKEMQTLITFVFLVPQQIVNKNDKFKRFLETTQFET